VKVCDGYQALSLPLRVEIVYNDASDFRQHAAAHHLFARGLAPVFAVQVPTANRGEFMRYRLHVGGDVSRQVVEAVDSRLDSEPPAIPPHPPVLWGNAGGAPWDHCEELELWLPGLGSLRPVRATTLHWGI
jgi:hypothetical protein